VGSDHRLRSIQVGGLALNVRYLRRQGLDPAGAVAGVALTQLVGVTMHLALTTVFVLWAGSTADIVPIPSSTTVLLVLVVVVAVVGLSLLLRPLRRLVHTHVVPALRSARDSVRDALADPARLSVAFAGSLLLDLANIGALYASVRAFHVQVGLAVIGAVYLAGSAVASAAPTPGGVGAVEAALIAGLTAVGVPTSAAVPGVLVLPRHVWIPVPPGWLAFTRLSRPHVI
jgi:uncharacterized protein (TIRG00374 family)